MTPPSRQLSILMLNHAYLVEPLRALGHSVFSVGCTPTMLSDPFDLKISDPPILALEELREHLPNGFSPDVIIFNDSSEFPRILGLDRATVPTVFFSIDAHIHASWHKFFGGVFDHVLLAQPDYLDEYRTVNAHSSWFPLWADTFTEPDAHRPVDVSFRGSFSKTTQSARIAFFEELSKLVAVDVATAPYAETYRKSKIVINQVLKNDLNFRVFEGIGCGALMVTPFIQNGMQDLFVAGEDLVGYENENPRDAAAQLKRYLTDEHELQRLAWNGYRKVREYHSSEVRARMLSELICSLTQNRDVSKHLNASIAYLHNIQGLSSGSEEIRLILLAGCTEALIHYVQQDGAIHDVFNAAASATIEKLRQDGQDKIARDFQLFLEQQTGQAYE